MTLELSPGEPEKHRATDDSRHKNHEWISRYNAHLRSEKWNEIRRKILLRCNFMCEGCGAQEAARVHHLSYVRLGDEMLFDLVGLCLACHQKVHPDKETT